MLEIDRVTLILASDWSLRNHVMEGRVCTKPGLARLEWMGLRPCSLCFSRLKENF